MQVLVRMTLIYRTVIHLKLTQIKYQIWYRIKSRFLKISWYKKYSYSHLDFVSKPSSTNLIAYKGKYLGPLHFKFLNQTHQFKKGELDWNFSEFGKLWNYNLQYFDYLHNPYMPIDEKEELIIDFCNSIYNNKVKLEPYPTSLRIINWILFSSRTGFKSYLFENCVKQQINYLENNLEYHIQANHLMENLISLCVSAIALKNQKLFEQSYLKLEKELKEQILKDGGHYECSPMYHCIILSKLLILAEALNSNSKNLIDFPVLTDRIGRMIGWLHAICFKKGIFIHFNDSANEIAVGIDLLEKAADVLNIMPNQQPLSDSGYRKLGVGEMELLVDVGGIIPSYQPGHAHSDMLSFGLFYKSMPMIIDLGTSTYQLGSVRQFERSTKAHNTVTINNHDQSEIWGGFRVGRRANIIIEKDSGNQLIASHDGYVKIFGKTHRRNFSVVDEGISITDEIIDVNGSQTENIARFYLDASTLPEYDENCSAVKLNEQIKISFEGNTSISITSYDQPFGYNLFQKSKVIEVIFGTQLQSIIQCQ
jgi:uncharacterized heparinase superfamily protein